MLFLYDAFLTICFTEPGRKAWLDVKAGKSYSQPVLKLTRVGQVRLATGVTPTSIALHPRDIYVRYGYTAVNSAGKVGCK